jgi:histidinol phosphatase-like enzyme
VKEKIFIFLAFSFCKEIFSFTNQPGIADGIATVADFVQELEGFGFDDIYVCPHKHL